MKTLSIFSGSLVNSLLKLKRLGELQADFFNDIMLLILFHVFLGFLTLFMIGGGGAWSPPTSFPLVTSRNVRISPQNFMTFSFNPLPHWCKISSLYLMPVSNYSTWAKTTPQKKQFLWSNPYKIEVVITSVVEMLESHEHIYNKVWITW